jgi:predicted nucleotidyltransferase
VIVYGSFVRREADAESDIDVVVVRPREVDQDDDAWSASLEAWRLAVRRLTGNPVEVLEVDANDAGSKLRGRRQVWADIRRDGQVVHGLTIDELRAAHVG